MDNQKTDIQQWESFEKAYSEAIIIYTLYVNGEHAELIFSLLEPRYFNDAEFRTAFILARDLFKKGLFNPASCFDELRRNNMRPILAHSIVGTYGWREEYDEEAIRAVIGYVKESYVRNQLMFHFDQQSAGDLVDLLADYKEENRTLAQDNFNELMAEMVARDLETIAFPYPMLNNILGGMRKKEYIITAARPSVGKSVMLEQIFWEAPKFKNKALFISIEMSQEMILKRHITRTTGVDLFKDKVPMVKRADLYKQVGELLGNNKISTGPHTIRQIEKLIESEHPDIVLIDYLQLITHGDTRMSEYDRVTSITRNLKAIKDKFNIVLNVASQYSRLDSKQPTLADLRSSGQIEQDADIVLSLWRLNNEVNLDDSKTVYIDCLKNRNGVTFGNQIVKNPSTKVEEVDVEFSLTFRPTKVSFE